MNIIITILNKQITSGNNNAIVNHDYSKNTVFKN